VRWIEDGKNGYLKELSVNFLSYEEQVNRWRYFVDVEGTGYSGRLKFLLATHRIVLLIDRKHKEWFFKHLEPWTHYVPIEADMSDLADKLNYVRNNEGAERKILRFLPEFSDKFLSRRAAINRWARLLKGL
jgi:hypothetical protein